MTMKIVNIDHLDLIPFTTQEDPKQRCASTFPLLGANGTKESATVYFELEPGHHLGRHTDSAEELLLVLQGEVEAELDHERVILVKGDLVHVPKMVPHNFKNIGKERARVLGFFGGAANIQATFEKRWDGAPSNTVDTAALSQQPML
jgi:quercetin dioxygenase-like cupin family protein